MRLQVEVYVVRVDDALVRDETGREVARFIFVLTVERGDVS